MKCDGVVVTGKGFSGANRCIPCDDAYMAGAFYTGTRYRCASCLQTLPIISYSKDKDSPTRRRYICKDCDSKMRTGKLPGLKEIQMKREAKIKRKGEHRRYCNADFGYACCCRAEWE